MNYRVVKLKKLAAFLASGSFSLFLASSAAAQRNPTGPPPGAGPPPNNNPNLQDRARRADSEVRKWMPARKKRTKNSCRPRSQT